jgi:hypothetical protein
MPASRSTRLAAPTARPEAQGSSLGPQAVRRHIADLGSSPYTLRMSDAQTRQGSLLFSYDIGNDVAAVELAQAKPLATDRGEPGSLQTDPLAEVVGRPSEMSIKRDPIFFHCAPASRLVRQKKALAPGGHHHYGGVVN